MSPAPLPWPAPLAGTPTVSVLERAIERERLSHSLLLHGGNLGTLVYVAHAIADRLLNDPRHGAQHFPVKHHPDFFALRPSGKARDIKIGKADAPEENTMRDFISRLALSPTVSRRKVGIVYEADRMNPATSNAFLKTLEEPPGRSTLILLTTRPYSLLATIRSRCLHFRFTDAGVGAVAESDDATRGAWQSTLSAYSAWLEGLAGGATDKRAIADCVMGVYGLVTRFHAVLAAASEQVWNLQKEKLPTDLDDEEIQAIRTGIANGIRLRLFAEIESATREFAVRRLLAGDEPARRSLAAAVAELERDTSLLRLNLNESAAFESFLLSSLRIWSPR